MSAAESKGPRTTIEVRGARVHNLRNVTVTLPRDQLTVVTGLSGSGKSSLAFDTIYAEGQRRYMESLSSFAKLFIAQVAKPDVDFIHGLSPVISIGQKTITRNPRSTVGTMTDIASYLNLLFATVGQAHCPFCDRAVAMRRTTQFVEDATSKLITKRGAPVEVEVRAPLYPVRDEDAEFLYGEVRRLGYRRMVVDGKLVDASADTPPLAVPDRIEVIIGKALADPADPKPLATLVANATLVGDGFVAIIGPKGPAAGCKEHGYALIDVGPDWFMFNNPEAACRTCGGLGTSKIVIDELLTPDPSRSMADGCFVKEAFRYNPDSWDGMAIWAAAQAHGFDLTTPWQDMAPKAVDVVLHGSDKTVELRPTPETTKDLNPKYLGQPARWAGVVTRINRWYRRYRERDTSSEGMEAWLEKVMVDVECPECEGARLRVSRRKVQVSGLDLHEVGDLTFAGIGGWLETLDREALGEGGRRIVDEIRARTELLLGIGLDYLTFNRHSSTLSGGEAQRTRLSTQIGSGLMAMLYVLDEPSIGLHPKDNAKMIATLRRLVDLGNTVIVVEHDEDTIRAADHLIEMGPGAGVHGGHVVASGTLDDILTCGESPTGQYLSGKVRIDRSADRRPPPPPGEGWLTVRGAREHNLQRIDAAFPLARFTCVTGASGSGKSTLVTDILYMRLHKQLIDSRTWPGAHDAVEGIEQVAKVVDIDQRPIGRNSRSNPVSYLGCYDDIRKAFAATPAAKERGYTSGRFSFNVADGRCAECAGEGVVRTQLYFMPDVESTCNVCRGARFNAETLEVTYEGLTIAEVLDLSVEDGVVFFAAIPGVARKLGVLLELGLGYLTLGQSSTTLSGGEAQRVKLAAELSKLKRGGHVLYLLDEPTTGLHLADVDRLLAALHRLVDAGNTVIVVEHHSDVIKTADWVIDLGPEGGDGGGLVVVAGTPEEVAACATSHTGRFLAQRMAGDAAP